MPGKRRLRLGKAGVALAAFLAMSGPTWAATSWQFNPSDDACVKQSQPAGNWGGEAALLVRGPATSQRIDSYLKFTVSGVGATVASATLRLYALANMSNAATYAAASSAWTQGAVTWNSAPGLGRMLDAAVNVVAGQWIEFDVTSHIAGNGVFSFGLSSTQDADGLGFASMEEGSHRPELRIEAGGPAPDRRENYGARLEPVNKALNIAGRPIDGNAEAFENYRAALPNAHPAAYMTCRAFSSNHVTFHNNLRPLWWDPLMVRLGALGEEVGLQVGLSFAGYGLPAELAGGGLNDEVQAFLALFAEFGRPIYLRLGYECNETSRNPDYADKEKYRAAWQRVADAVRAYPLNNVAMVWCAAASGEPTYMDWHPGDGWVDWWALDIFSPSEFTSALTTGFLEEADAHGKPVMIGECSATAPYDTPGGQSSWDNWFTPFFIFLRAHKGVKAFSYTNVNWALDIERPTWGDARIEASPLINSCYAAEMADPLFQHAGLLAQVEDWPEAK